MCGIAGILGDQRSRNHIVADVERMTTSLAHRGPDDSGIELGEGWALGMQRLAIQDPSLAGHQPMSRGDLTIVFNGEVYNFNELRRELRSLGYGFQSGTDTEVVLNAFREWGTDSFERFNGMFSLAIVDSARKRAWLARDRFGKKPLFLARFDGSLLFASELKAILAVRKHRLTLSLDALASYFRFLYVPAPLSIFEQVKKLRPASWLELDFAQGARALPERVYWRLSDDPSTEDEPGPEAVLEAVRESVRRRLIADVPVGAFLSGGIDSTLVVASMCELSTDVRTFTIGFEDERYDESRHAAAVASYLGTDHSDLVLSPPETLRLLEDMPGVYDEPFADSSAIPTMAVARLARREVTVALSGDGGDELFAGYPRYRLPPPVRMARWLPRVIARRLADSERMRQRHARISAYAGAGSFGAGYQELISTWRSAELRKLIPNAVPVDQVRDLTDAAPGGPVERMMRADAASYLIDDILQKVDRATMAIGLEARNPLLDPGVVGLAMAAVAKAEQAPGEKRLLSSALQRKVPRELVDRPKRGFSVPVGEWLRGPLRPLLDELVLSRRDAEYSVAVARDVCEAHLRQAANPISATSRVWSLLAFEMWRQRWWS